MRAVIGEIIDKCECGAAVSPHKRQQLTWTGTDNVFYRRCGDCLKEDARTGVAMIVSNTTGVYDCVMDGGKELK